MAVDVAGTWRWMWLSRGYQGCRRKRSAGIRQHTSAYVSDAVLVEGLLSRGNEGFQQKKEALEAKACMRTNETLKPYR